MNDDHALDPNSSDRNFDDLAGRFQRNVYGGLKGQIRLRVLARDYDEFVPELKSTSLKALDAGGGQGQIACYLAALGHQVVLCDISQAMLELAAEEIAARELSSAIELRHQAIQHVNGEFDFIACHAVLEWVEAPEALLSHITSLLKPGGVLSLTYYNLNGLIFKNLLRTNYKKLRKQHWRGHKGSLTPTHPLEAQQVDAWLAPLPLKILCSSGIRVFHDYVLNPTDRHRDPESVLEMELRYSRIEPYRSLGRYVHVLLRKW